MTTHAVIGDGWGALGAVALLLQKNQPVVWISGTHSKVHPILPSLQAGAGADLWRSLCHSYQIETAPEHESQSGSLIREFKNKSFRAAENAALQERLWEAERGFASEGELRFGMPLFDLEAALRAKVLDSPNLKRIEGIPFSGVQVEEGQLKAIVLGSGEVLPCEFVVYADRWNVLGQVEGLPKGLSFTRKRDPIGILQVALTHDSAPQGSPTEAYFCALTRDAGEDFERNVWGYFSQEGKQSVWSIAVTQEEGEDNHLLAKKLRKMKAAVDKMFSGTEFTSNVRSERVSFQESVLFTAGISPSQLMTAPGIEGLYFVTDGYGPSSAFEQLSLLPGFADSQRTNAERERMDLSHSSAL